MQGEAVVHHEIPSNTMSMIVSHLKNPIPFLYCKNDLVKG